MTRPRKATVDYFPHYCSHKKTMFIIEGRHGNDGYATWFKILEMLGASEGHFVDCNDYSSYAYLIAKTNVKEDKFLEIVGLLAEINAIDSDLWNKNKIIWSQNFVDNLEEVYSRRKIEKPSIKTIGIDLSKENDEEFNRKQWCRSATSRAIKQGLITKGECQVCGSDVDIEAHHENYDEPFNVAWLCKNHHIELHKTHSNGNMTTLNPLNGQSDDINPQSIVEESRVKESRVKQTCAPEATQETANGKSFDRFWERYPRKAAKPSAKKVWTTAEKKKDFPGIEKVLDAIDLQKTWQQWATDNGKYIPYPTTWINREGWNDEPPVSNNMNQRTYSNLKNAWEFANE